MHLYVIFKLLPMKSYNSWIHIKYMWGHIFDRRFLRRLYYSGILFSISRNVERAKDIRWQHY